MRKKKAIPEEIKPIPMLTIKFKDTICEIPVTWESSDETHIPDYSLNDIVYVEASGEGLKYIYEHFQNIPKTDNKPNVRWYGEYARFILTNL